MIEEIFASGHSFIHKTDPRCRVVAATLLCFVIALGQKMPMLWTGLGLSVILVLWARLNLIQVFRRLIFVWGFLLFLWGRFTLYLRRRCGPADRKAWRHQTGH